MLCIFSESKISKRRLLWTLCAPLTIGNPADDESNTPDGKVSATVMAACVLPFFFVITLVFSLTQKWMSSLQTPRYIILFLLLTTSNVIVIGLAIAVIKNREQFVKRNDLMEYSQKPKLMFLWLFGLCIIVNESLNMSGNIHCIVTGGTETFRGEQACSVVVHVIAIIFYCGQLGFLSYFVNFTFISCVLLNYCMSCLLITHVMNWFNISLGTLFRNKIISVHYNYTELNSTDCFWHTDINKYRKQILPFIIPAQTEFSLLSAAFILRMWTGTGERTREDTELATHANQKREMSERTPLLSDIRERTGNNNTGPGQSSNFKGLLHVDINGDGTTDQRFHTNARSPGDGGEDIHHRSRCSVGRQTLPETTRASSSVYITIILAVVLSMPLLVGVIYAINVRENPKTMSLVLAAVRLVFVSVYFIAVIASYKLLETNCERNNKMKNLSGKEYISILCSGGAVGFLTFVLLAGFLQRDENYIQTVRISVVECVLNIVCIYLQTVLIIHSDQCEKSSSNTKLENLFAFLSVLNIVLWFMDSYASSHHIKTYRAEHAFYGTMYWSVIVEIVFPFTIFYRFHSSLDIYEKYCTFRSGVRVKNEQAK